MEIVKFDKGDVVVLKSGGPEMTVKRLIVLDNVSYECEWFQDGGYVTAILNKYTLKKIR